MPIYVLPLFNRFEPLVGSLEVRLRALAARFGVGDAEILRMDMSRQTKKANAFVAGIGSTHRIVLGDTLIDAFEPDEITFVVAHELGHYVSRDTWRMIALAESVTAGLLGLVASGLRDDASSQEVSSYCASLHGSGRECSPCVRQSTRFRVRANGPPTASRLQPPAMPAAALQHSAVCAIKIFAEEEPPAWYEWLFASHPSLGKRIEALMELLIRVNRLLDRRGNEFEQVGVEPILHR